MMTLENFKQNFMKYYFSAFPGARNWFAGLEGDGEATLQQWHKTLGVYEDDDLVAAVDTYHRNPEFKNHFYEDHPRVLAEIAQRFWQRRQPPQFPEKTSPDSNSRHNMKVLIEFNREIGRIRSEELKGNTPWHEASPAITRRIDAAKEVALRTIRT